MRINSVYYYNSYGSYKTGVQGFRANNRVTPVLTQKATTAAYYHRTYLFRDYGTNKFVKNYIQENMKSKPEINIVSAGCSSGEEVYSIAMMLDDMKDKVKITGFDASEEEIKTAKKGEYGLDDYKLLQPSNNCPDELNRAEKFKKYFEPIKSGEFIQYRLKDGAFDNCSFFPEDVRNLDKLFKDNSVDILFVRNVLYHIMFGPGILPLSNSREIFTDIARQMNKVVAPGGLVVMGSEDPTLLEAHDIVEDIMNNMGFEPVHKQGTVNNVWRKVS